jgi:ABC-type Fe3+/spermidine/putrescine transport system ATPase subunit
MLRLRIFFHSYGLLGPSGCGKSTLLQCILGTMSLDSGSIDLRAKTLKDVGYMPQVNI